MPFALAREHLDFFHRNRYIEFEDLLTDTEVSSLSLMLRETVGKRLNTAPESISNVELPSLYLKGRDTWRDNKELKKFVLHSHLAEIASNLTKFRPIRIAFDQFFTSSIGSPLTFKTPPTLHEMSSIEGAICGCLLNLFLPNTPSPQEILTMEGDTTTLVPLSKKRGSAIFFRPDLPLSLDYLAHRPNVQQLLIVYAKETSLYRHLSSDPHTHTLKKLGYVFGDRLQNTTHPITYQG